MVGFKYHNFVRLQGFSNAAYNGKLARIETIADPTTGRYRVALQDDDEAAVASHLSREILVKPENMLRACDCCHRADSTTMQYCGRCRNAAYCNAECQRGDWKRHKADCSKMNCQRQIIKSPLFLAVTVGNLPEVANLVRAGADVNTAAKEDGSCLLYMAAETDQLAVVKYLVQQGAEKDTADNAGATPLFMAALQGHLAVLQYLAQQGADKNKANNNGTTPLHIAAQKGHLAVVQCLVQQGADKDKVNNSGCSAVYIAAAQGHLAVVKYLVQQGADKNKAASNDTTPLSAASSQGHIALAAYLREQGAV
jgi:ankyrin repeat protein